MTDSNLPVDRFAWLGNSPPPDGVVVPESDAPPLGEDIIPVNQAIGSDWGLGTFRWLMASEEERKETLSGCMLFDNFVYTEIPRGDD